MRIVLGSNFLATYPQGGGNWMIALQYLLGLLDLGHDVLLLELLHSGGDANTDQHRIDTFFATFKQYGCEDKSALLLLKPGTRGHNCDRAEAFGRNRSDIDDYIRSTDVLWNICGSFAPPLLNQFRYRAYLDLDPGHMQVSALTVDMNLSAHESLLTLGMKVHDADCGIPTLGRQWFPFTPFVYLPMWAVGSDPANHAPFTSITHWNWGELEFNGRLLSLSKREAYLRYVELPKHAGRPFELAVSLAKEDDPTDDRARLQEQGWRLVNPWEIAQTPATYQKYIAESRAEISCPKPIFRELKTGWLSDRSVCFLASGRPVLAEDTGFSEFLPTGDGIVAFRNMEEAVAGVVKIDEDYQRQSRAARELAEDVFDSRKCIASMLDACG